VKLIKPNPKPDPNPKIIANHIDNPKMLGPPAQRYCSCMNRIKLKATKFFKKCMHNTCKVIACNKIVLHAIHLHAIQCNTRLANMHKYTCAPSRPCMCSNTGRCIRLPPSIIIENEMSCTCLNVRVILCRHIIIIRSM